MKQCLVVDDSRVVRRVARNMLEEMGMHVDEAENGQVALDYVGEKVPAFILLDWNMPVMDGMEFLQKLRAMPSIPQPKVVFCTTENDMEHIANAIANGADEYIMKPFDSDILRDKLATIGLFSS